MGVGDAAFFNTKTESDLICILLAYVCYIASVTGNKSHTFCEEHLTFNVQFLSVITTTPLVFILIPRHMVRISLFLPS